MLVALAIRGGNELMEYGQVYHLWKQTEVLYECYEVQKVLSRCLSKCPDLLYSKRSAVKDTNKIEDRDIPRSMRNELTYLAKCKEKIKGLNPLVNEMEELINEQIPALISQIQELRESLQKEMTV
jgi:hypothetical protein